MLQVVTITVLGLPMPLLANRSLTHSLSHLPNHGLRGEFVFVLFYTTDCHLSHSTITYCYTIIYVVVSYSFRLLVLCCVVTHTRD
jgi:hypothetical protein